MKYRIKQNNTPGGFVYEISEEESARNAALRAEIEQKIVPCAKTKEEFRVYLTETLGMQQVPINEVELRDTKAQFIIKLCPEILTTAKISVQEDMYDALQSVKDRFLEAKNIPLEQTSFVITKYAMEYYVGTHKLADVIVYLEENSFTYYAAGNSYTRTDEEDRQARYLFDDIILFRGVTEEDIRTKSEWYSSYAALLTSHAREGRQ